MTTGAESIMPPHAQPVTRPQLADDLRHLGVQLGQTLMVHCAMSALGWVVGGAQAVIEALREAVSPTGTLAMPAHTPDWSDPAQWQRPPVSEEWWPIIREHWPAFDPGVTPSNGMGTVAETFRAMPATRRSAHPQVSLAAQGPCADDLVAEHPLAFGFGPESPYGKLYQDDAQILLLGVGYERCTLLHLAEHRVGPPRIPVQRESFAVQIEGERHWVTVDKLLDDDSRFPAIGRKFETQSDSVCVGRVGLAKARLIPAKPLVEFAEAYLADHLK